jgi:DNA-binding NarL/FixJ family response regulator
MKVLVIDDHPLIFSALRSLIERVQEGSVLLGAEGADEARALLASEPDIDLILLDLILCDIDGFELLAELRQSHPSVPVMVVSASEKAEDMMQVLEYGAMGYVPKRASNELLAEALQLVMAGGVYVPPMVELGAAEPQGPSLSAASLSAVVAGSLQPSSAAPARQAPAPNFESLALTARQRDVLALLLEGKSNKAIAREMGLSVETIKDHVAAVLRGLGVHSRTQAVLAVAHLQAPAPAVLPAGQ